MNLEPREVMKLHFQQIKYGWPARYLITSGIYFYRLETGDYLQLEKWYFLNRFLIIKEVTSV